MAQRIQGTEDLYGGYMRSWQRMQSVAGDLFGVYGFEAIETPAIEQVATFTHGIGESTDVVRKEMFRVFSGALLEGVFAHGDESRLKARQRMAMRPEGTAGVVRAAVEHNLVPKEELLLRCGMPKPCSVASVRKKGASVNFIRLGLNGWARLTLQPMRSASSC
jgi:histidyl-tRNA synthetase